MVKNVYEKIVECCNFTVNFTQLKVKQRDAKASLLEGKEVLSLLSTGFQKSLYFTTAFCSSQNTTSYNKGDIMTHVVVSCPLESIITDHIWTELGPFSCLTC